jgi:hypothetical protein
VKRKTDVYLQFAPGRYSTDLRLVGATSKKPAKPKGGAVVVKLNVTLPDGVFDPFTPAASIEIPDHHVEPVVVTSHEQAPYQEES